MGFYKEHRVGARITAGALIGTSIATAALVQEFFRLNEEQRARDAYPLPAAYCESPPARFDSDFTDPLGSDFLRTGGLSITGTTAGPADSVRVQYQARVKHLVEFDTPVMTSEPIPVAGETFQIRMVLPGEEKLRIIGITAISSIPNGERTPAVCNEPPRIDSTTIGPDVYSMPGHVVRPQS